jgi:hypothetical protein
MLKEHPKLIVRSCFVDPVTFCSWEGGQRLFLSFAYCDLTVFIQMCVIISFIDLVEL